MKIKDYLKYYIGQQCQCYNGTEYEVDGKIIGIDISGGNGFPVRVKCPSIKYPDKLPSEVLYDWNEVKPYLRPLSLMTEEEAIEVTRFVVHYGEFKDVQTYRNGFGNIVVSWGDSLKEKYSPHAEKCWTPEQFDYLLSIGIDLFSLTVNDLAVVSKTNNNDK